MAGDWLKMRTALGTDARVDQIAAMVGESEPALADLPYPLLRHMVVGALHSFWTRMQETTADGRVPHVSPQAVDNALGIAGFFLALEHVGWIKNDGDGGVIIPDWAHHNSSCAKSRAVEQRKKAIQRSRTPKTTPKKCPAPVPLARDKSGTESGQSKSKSKRQSKQQKGAHLSDDPETPSALLLECRRWGIEDHGAERLHGIGATADLVRAWGNECPPGLNNEGGWIIKKVMDREEPAGFRVRMDAKTRRLEAFAEIPDGELARLLELAVVSVGSRERMFGVECPFSEPIDRDGLAGDALWSGAVVAEWQKGGVGR